MRCSPPHAAEAKTRTRALRVFEAIQEDASDVMLGAHTPGTEHLANEAARCASEAETAVIDGLRTSDQDLVRHLLRLLRRLRSLKTDLRAAASAAVETPDPRTVA